MTRYVNREVMKMAANGEVAFAGVIGRGTGRSTASILHAVAIAIERPNEPTRVCDHSWGVGTVVKPSQYAVLCAHANAVIQKLGLEKMVAKVSRDGGVIITNTFLVEIY